MSIGHKYTTGTLGLLALCFTLSCNSGTEQQANNTAETTATETAAPQETQQAAPSAPVSAEPAKAIPDFTFYILKNGIRFNKEDLAKNGNITFILFDPSCSHCQHEARDLGQHYDKLKNSNLYFVSMNDPALMNSFLETFAKPLVDKTNITVLYDRDADFINKFHIPSQYPATYVYGADGQLKEHWSGDRAIDEIITAITQ
ncbi:peroxiredoxin family protein [Parapedobacter lycopersici]|uniref:peroxiredoxin family protein n=1 Tax=Parapedobacter lycopersici TaxID=1864939 RepID=UPI00214D40D4|nr:peroxiredoxin family protein [Parapedobacter lycopersici]